MGLNAVLVGVRCMKLYTVPLFSDSSARWTEMVDLGKDRYMLYFSWNTRCKFWEMSVFNSNKEIIVGGIRIVTVIDLLDEYRARFNTLPPGALQVVPRNDVVGEITRDNFARDFMLMYVEED